MYLINHRQHLQITLPILPTANLHFFLTWADDATINGENSPEQTVPSLGHWVSAIYPRVSQTIHTVVEVTGSFNSIKIFLS